MYLLVAVTACFSFISSAYNVVDDGWNQVPGLVKNIQSNEDASCPFYGHWVLDHDTWPSFRLTQMRPITLRPEGDRYRLISRLDNLFTTLLQPESPSFCNNKIAETRTVSTKMATPNWEAEEQWLNMLDNIRRIKFYDGKLIVWFSEGYKWRRIEFLRSTTRRDL